jgi:hypothetical protein
MKKLLVLFIVLLGVFYLTGQVKAQTDGENNRFNPKVKVNQKKEQSEKTELRSKLNKNLKLNLQDKKASIEAKLSDKKKNIISNYWQRLVKRINSSIDRLDKLTQRIESRLLIIETKNPSKDTTPIHSQLNEVKTKLTDAKTKLSALNTVVTESLNSEKPKETFLVIKDGIKEVKSILMDVHKVLVHIIGDIRGLHVGEEDLNENTPTITSSVTPTLTLTPTPSVTPTMTPEVTPTLTLTPTPSPEPSITL